MITLTMERLDHAVVLKLPTDHEHVMVALWRLGLNRDPHMYTLGELNAVFSYDTPEEHQMVRLIDMNNSLHFALCSLHEMLAPPVPYAQQLRKKLQSGSYRSAKDFYYGTPGLSDRCADVNNTRTHGKYLHMIRGMMCRNELCGQWCWRLYAAARGKV